VGREGKLPVAGGEGKIGKSREGRDESAGSDRKFTNPQHARWRKRKGREEKS